jgi:hypothetical protein
LTFDLVDDILMVGGKIGVEFYRLPNVTNKIGAIYHRGCVRNLAVHNFNLNG